MPSNVHTDLLCNEVEDIFNREVFGKSINNETGQWKIPMEDHVLTKVSFSNTQARHVCKNLHRILPFICKNLSSEESQKWARAVDLYCQSMQLLRARHHFTIERVLEFQKTVDDFMDLWHILTGRDGFGNYMHALDVGHVGEQLLAFGNLYRYSQQGWEALNKKFKHSFFYNTCRGGGRHGVQSKILSIMYMFLREMFWRFGWAEEFFSKYIYPKVEGEEFHVNMDNCYDRPKKLDDTQIETIAKAIVDLGDEFDVMGSEVAPELQDILDNMDPEEYNRIIEAFE